MPILKEVEYWEERYKEELEEKEGSKSCEISYQLGILAYTIMKMIDNYNKLANDLVKSKWIWWVRAKFCRRLFREHHVKTTRRKDLHELWMKFDGYKKCKIKGKGLENVTKNVLIGILTQMRSGDKNKQPYDYILDKLNNLNPEEY